MVQIHLLDTRLRKRCPFKNVAGLGVLTLNNQTHGRMKMASLLKIKGVRSDIDCFESKQLQI